MNVENLVYCKAIRNSLLESIEKRFCNILNFNTIEAENAAIAAFSYPQFKNKWLNCIDSASHDKLLSIFKKAVSAEFNSTKINEDNFESQVDNYFDFFDFGPATQADRNTTVKSTSAEIEVLKYFEDPRSRLESLSSHLTIKKIFLLYNTPIASSAPVERLFSFATMTNVPKSNRLLDELFEQKVILKANLNNQLK